MTARLWTARQVSAEMGRNSRMTGTRLATAAGLPYRNLMRCLNGERPFTIDELARISEALEVPVTDLVGTATRQYSDILAAA